MTSDRFRLGHIGRVTRLIGPARVEYSTLDDGLASRFVRAVRGTITKSSMLVVELSGPESAYQSSGIDSGSGSTAEDEGGKHMKATINGRPQAFQPGERLIDLITRTGTEVPNVCYHSQLGPIQSCDTCMVEVDGKLVRACGTVAADGMNVVTSSPRADAAQREAFDRILGNHLLYCTVCDNNNGNCTVHNTTKLLAVEHQEIPYKPKPYEVDMSNPFYRYDPDQCILCGRCVQACQTLQVNETSPSFCK